MPEPSGVFTGGSMGDGVATDDSARFAIVGLAPGLHDAASASDLDPQGARIGGLLDDVAVEPGQVRDLGDLKVRPLPRHRPRARWREQIRAEQVKLRENPVRAGRRQR